WPNEPTRKSVLCRERPRHASPRVTSSTAPPEEDEMGRTVAAFVVAASLLTLASSEASAWVCYATGLGSGGDGRAYDIIDAKLLALRRCERNSPVPVCTLLWCRPGRWRPNCLIIRAWPHAREGYFGRGDS